jgi:uncharacterized Zn-binding protein involved in type VI secretion
MKRSILCLLILAAAASARAQAPAARVGDVTSHGGLIVGPGVPSVLIAGQPAAVRDDFASCPLSSPDPTPVPHVGGLIVTGSATVMIGGRPAARVGDSNAEVGASATILTGALTVIIGP